MAKGIVFDLEALDNKPTSVVLDLAAVVFDTDDNNSFRDIIADSNRTFHVKFDVRGQIKSGRSVGKQTVAWWANQGEEARAILKPSVRDVSLTDGMARFREFCEWHGINKSNGQAYCRGQSFDFAIIADIVDKLEWEIGYSMFPVAFWNQNDIRTALRWVMAAPDLRKLPIKRGAFEGFVAHNSVHDCAKDVILLQTALRYATGQEDIPDDAEWF